ncbi:GspE/PulE family protein [Lentisphaera profundi]|uniref:GspE/PulE family protein n=1 Tax=Lentisphaera profundi TaxID=1658616 RepID=A0ABY7W158_9BACT|nr:GspE/PulE family protein [Lentisphaera profundi]WDE98008.1 GspE/PulE family protein [Lentisphaera profundi]
MDTNEELDLRFKEVVERLQEADKLEDTLWEIEADLLDIFGAERFTIFQKDENDKEIVSWYRTSSDSVDEIRLYTSPSSLAGYVAMTRQALMVDDAYDSEYLESVHPELRFDDAYDRSSGYMSEAMIMVPIIHKDKLYGIFQVINNIDGGAFPDETYFRTVEFAKVVSENFRYELKSSRGAFDQLVEAGVISVETFEEAEEMSSEEGIPLASVLKNKFSVNAADLGNALSDFYQVPYHPFDPSFELDPSLIENLNVGFLASNSWVPIMNDGEHAVVLMSDPANEELIMEIQNIVKAIYYDFHVAFREDIDQYLGLSSKEEERLKAFGQLDDIMEGESASVASDELGESEEDGDILDSNEESKIIQLVNKIIVRATMDGCSDIHIEPHKGKRPGEVRFRIDGVCSKVFDIPASLMGAVLSRIKILSNLDIAEKRKPQDGKMGLRFQGATLELRVATLPVVNGESAVMRILAQGEPLPFNKLMLSPGNESKLLDLLKNPHGIMLVVGPTGSGKTTTLHAVLGTLNNEERKILTAEDPVEITQAGLQQVQMQPRKGLTFAIALRAFLRCDPDIILIGEMRDAETAEAGVEASLTGHLVFSTLHTNSAPETVIRLLDIGLDPMNFADALVGVLAQRLMRTLCGKCKQPVKPEKDDLDKLIHFYGEEFVDELGYDFDTHEIMEARGCDKCGETGYKGRVGIHELMEATPEMKKLVAKASPVALLKEQAVKDGMRTLMQDGVWKIFEGVSDLAQLRRVQAH